MNARVIAAEAINTIIQKQRTLSAVLPELRKSARDQAWAQELTYGTLRWYHRLNVILNLLLTKPLSKKDGDVHCLLLIGLYQLLYTRVPTHAAVSETVEATRILKKSWAAALVNKILRRWLREKNSLLTQVDASIEGRYSHPTWLIASLQKTWPADWEKIVYANNDHPPMILRVNHQRISRADYLKLLQTESVIGHALAPLPEAVQLEHPMPAEKLPGFSQGFIYIQDIASQFAAHLLDVKAHQRVLDACAAPGGKTTHILELEPHLKKLVAIDKDPLRLQKIPHNVDRLQLPHDNLQLILAEAENTTFWWTGEPFDRILLDAPCSATGVIRRHPDIKLSRQASDIALYANRQLKLLKALWPLLSPGGQLLYSTCSILREENENVVQSFVSQQRDAKILPMSLPMGRAVSIGHQILPSESGADGFYYALLRKHHITE